MCIYIYDNIIHRKKNSKLQFLYIESIKRNSIKNETNFDKRITQDEVTTSTYESIFLLPIHQYSTLIPISRHFLAANVIAARG